MNNIFSDKELEFFNNKINKISIPVLDDGSYIYDTDLPLSEVNISKYLGRLQMTQGFIPLPDKLYDKLDKLAADFFDLPYHLSNIVYVEYNAAYGTPKLPPHFDEDSNDLIINYQLSSNTSWEVGINLEKHALEDNSALFFNGNTNIHWRPVKEFKDGEYVKMMFFRFCKKTNPSVYPVLSDKVKNKMFDEIYKIM